MFINKEIILIFINYVFNQIFSNILYMECRHYIIYLDKKKGYKTIFNSLFIYKGKKSISVKYTCAFGVIAESL